jgi:hypothetical protein
MSAGFPNFPSWSISLKNSALRGPPGKACSWKVSLSPWNPLRLWMARGGMITGSLTTHGASSLRAALRAPTPAGARPAGDRVSLTTHLRTAADGGDRRRSQHPTATRLPRPGPNPPARCPPQGVGLSSAAGAGISQNPFSSDDDVSSLDSPIRGGGAPRQSQRRVAASVVCRDHEYVQIIVSGY